MKHLRTTIAVLLLAAVSVAALGCASGDPLSGIEWRLTEWTVSSLDPDDFNITARFDDGEISGSSGVNTYSGPVTVGADGSFSAGPLSATEMAGSASAMRAEAAFMTLLTDAASYEVTDSTLTLRDEGGNDSLVFTRIAQ